jgi:hypothetical protein
MNAQDVIRQVQEQASEWLEMTEDPAHMVAGILANRIIKLMGHIEYLERRIDYDSTAKRNGTNTRHN